jgi:RimJ/RimL family protein N-acetyltransferase
MEIKNVSDQTSFNTERFKIRPLEMSDVLKIERYIRDERVAKSTGTIPHPLPLGFTEEWVRSSLLDDRSEDTWAIEVKISGKLEIVGVVSLNRMDRSQSEIAYWVVPSMWNTGIASEAVKAFIELNPQDCSTIFASVFQDNPASARVLTNTGFQYIGDAESFSVARENSVKTWTYINKLK